MFLQAKTPRRNDISCEPLGQYEAPKISGLGHSLERKKEILQNDGCCPKAQNIYYNFSHGDMAWAARMKDGTCLMRGPLSMYFLFHIPERAWGKPCLFHMIYCLLMGWAACISWEHWRSKTWMDWWALGLWRKLILCWCHQGGNFAALTLQFLEGKQQFWRGGL